MLRKSLVNISCGLLVILFMYTSTAKFLEFDNFYNEMNIQPFPNWMTPFLVWLLPVSEIVIVIGLIIEPYRKIGLLFAFILMSLFTIYSILVLANAFDRVPCSCGGVIKHLTWGQHVVFNIFFTVIAGLGLRLTNNANQKIISEKNLQGT